MKKDQYKLIIGALLIAVASFFAGTKYQLNKSTGSMQTAAKNGIKQDQSSNSQSQKAERQIPSAQNGQQGGGMVSGEITAIDDQSITVKSRDGSTKIVIIADSTNYKKNIDASLNDLSLGENVNVVGSSNSDGSITAKNVILGVVAEPIGQGRPTDSK